MLILDHEVPYSDSDDWLNWTRERRREMPFGWPEPGERRTGADGGRVRAPRTARSTSTRWPSRSRWRCVGSSGATGSSSRRTSTVLKMMFFFRHELQMMLERSRIPGHPGPRRHGDEEPTGDTRLVTLLWPESRVVPSRPENVPRFLEGRYGGAPRLGGCRLMVSVLGLGTTGWGAHQELGDVDAEARPARLRSRSTPGVNLFDTAETYGERALRGDARRGPWPAPSTRPSSRRRPSSASAASRRDRPVSATHHRQFCEGSLEQLKTDRIDLLRCTGGTGPCPSRRRSPLWRRSSSDGKVGYIGVSNWSAWHR